MTDEPKDLVLQILREIQATQAEHTRTLAEHSGKLTHIEEVVMLHGIITALENKPATQ